MFKTALEPNNFTITPTSFEALQEYISLIFPNKSDRGNAIMVAIQAWNLACNIAEQERGALQSEFEGQLHDMHEEVDGKIADLSDGLSDLVYQKEALQEEIDAHFAGFNINFKGGKVGELASDMHIYANHIFKG